MKTVSVIIPVYNVEEYLPDCIRSVTEQTYRNLEILLIDDGSKDGSGKICEEAAEKDSRIRVIHQENKGLSGARNTGLEYMSGDIIFFLDSDDTIREDTIEKMMEYSEEHKIVCCGILAKDSEHGDYVLTPPGSASLRGREAVDSMLFDRRINSCSWAKLYDKEMFRNVRFPPGKIHEDEFLTYRLLDDAGKVYYTEELLYFYRIRSGSITRNRYSEKHLARFEAYAERAEYFKNKGYIPEYEFTVIRIIDEAYHVIREHKEYRNRIREIVKGLDLGCLSFRVYPFSRLLRYEIKRLLVL